MCRLEPCQAITVDTLIQLHHRVLPNNHCQLTAVAVAIRIHNPPTLHQASKDHSVRHRPILHHHIYQDPVLPNNSQHFRRLVAEAKDTRILLQHTMAPLNNHCQLVAAADTRILNQLHNTITIMVVLNYLNQLTVAAVAIHILNLNKAMQVL